MSKNYTKVTFSKSDYSFIGREKVEIPSNVKDVKKYLMRKVPIINSEITIYYSETETPIMIY